MNLEKVYRKKGKVLVTANRGIDLEIPQKTIFGIFGPNGAGKTTLIKQMVGLLRPTAGEIYLYGQNVVKKSGLIPRYVSYCGQRLYHLWRLNAFEVLTLTGRLRGLNNAEAKDQANNLIEMINFEGKRYRLLRDCSGGELRIISVLTSLMGKKSIIVLDEPTEGLDPIIRKNLWEILLNYKKENNATIVLVTHNVYEAEKVVDYIAIIDEGKIIAQGKPSTLKNEFEEEVTIEVKTKFSIENSQFPGWIQIRDGVYCYKGKMIETERIISSISSSVGMEYIEDIKVTPFSLEDYYVKKVGKLWK